MAKIAKPGPDWASCYRRIPAAKGYANCESITEGKRATLAPANFPELAFLPTDSGADSHVTLLKPARLRRQKCSATFECVAAGVRDVTIFHAMSSVSIGPQGLLRALVRTGQANREKQCAYCSG